MVLRDELLAVDAVCLCAGRCLIAASILLSFVVPGSRPVNEKAAIGGARAMIMFLSVADGGAGCGTVTGATFV